MGQTFDDTIKSLGEAFSKQAFLRRHMNAGSIDALENAFRIMKASFEAAKTEPPKKASPAEVESISRAIYMLADIFITGEITKDFISFCSSYALLVYNWNNNMATNPNIGLGVRILNRLIGDRLSMDDAISVMKLLVRKLKSLAEYQPPAFSLSRHYEEVLQDIISSEASGGQVCPKT